ncbi:MAG TPA: response regulator [Lacipirellulaceae bacterium]|jgi:response regulator NasT
MQVRIAVADDEPQVRRTFVCLLEALGHEVVCSASNGAELIELCSAREVDMAFVDLDMPVMDGLAAAVEMSKQGIPVVLISGHPDAYDVVVEHEPVVARLLKPTSVDDLCRAIDAALASKR